MLRGFGEGYHLLGPIETALDYSHESLPIARAIGDRDGESRSLHLLVDASRP